MLRKPSMLAGLALALLLFRPGDAFAGPPLLCHPFEIGAAASLEWGDDWNRPHAGFDLQRLGERTEALLSPGTPVIARMETLRRAAIYASRDGQALAEVQVRLDARIAAAASADARALALFDAGYFSETLEDVVRLQGYDMPGIGRVDAAALRRAGAGRDGYASIVKALSLRPDDAAMHFAAALVARADARGDEAQRHARLARAGAASDGLLARNLGQTAM